MENSIFENSKVKVKINPEQLKIDSLFEKIIDRVECLVETNYDLVLKIYNKIVKLDGTDSFVFIDKKDELCNTNIIDIIDYKLDNLEYCNSILKNINDSLDNSIGNNIYSD